MSAIIKLQNYPTGRFQTKMQRSGRSLFAIVHKRPEANVLWLTQQRLSWYMANVNGQNAQTPLQVVSNTLKSISQ